MPDLSTLAALDSIDPATKVAIAVRIKSIWTVMTEVGKFPELWSIVIIIFVSGVIGFIRMIQREFKLAINKLARIVFKWSATTWDFRHICRCLLHIWNPGTNRRHHDSHDRTLHPTPYQ